MVFSWNIKQLVKKRFVVSSKEIKEWDDFTKKMGKINPKEVDISLKNISIYSSSKLDLHGFSLEKSNQMVKKFIINSFNLGKKKITIITGKGSRSKSHNNPYVSEKLSILKFSVPEFIENNEDLNNKVFKIAQADKKNGGEGAFHIFLKKN